MTRTASPISSSPRRRRARRPPIGDLFGALALEEVAARELADDLAALVQAGLISPATDGGELRFAAVDVQRGGVSTNTPHRAGRTRASAPARSDAACKTDEQGVG